MLMETENLRPVSRPISSAATVASPKPPADNAPGPGIPAVGVAGVSSASGVSSAGMASKIELRDPSFPIPNVNGLNFRSWGDPHEVTGDGLTFDNMGIGYYTALKSASGDLVVTKRQEKVDGLGAVGSTVNTEAAVKAGKDIVRYDAKADKLWINDQETTLNEGVVHALSGGGNVSKLGNKIKVTSPLGDEITIVDHGKYMDLEGKLSLTRKDGEVTGSLGRFDADTDSKNDLVKRDGTLAKEVSDFLADWVTPESENLLTQPASKFVSKEAIEVKALQNQNSELFKKEQAASESRRPLLGDFTNNESIYIALKALPPENISEADQSFMKKFEATKAKVENLGTQVADLNAEQAANVKKIDALRDILRLRGDNALLFETEQARSHERRPLLGEQAELRAKAEALQVQQTADPSKVSEADAVFLKRYQQVLDRIADLGRLINRLNLEQKKNEDRIRELDLIAHPKGLERTPGTANGADLRLKSAA